MTIIKRIPFRFAVNLMLAMLSLVVVFHLLVLIELIPYSIVWGGRIQDPLQMRTMEAVSLTVNLIMIAAIAVKGLGLRVSLSPTLIAIVLWLMVAIFALNTIGNLFAASRLETILFTPLTLIAAVLCFRIAVE
ncbi:MAG: hypothetical protein JNM27_06655 [Leptospirales bacterium]|nr:hypothetical protein [Leptospirales bacterium]